MNKRVHGLMNEVYPGVITVMVDTASSLSTQAHLAHTIVGEDTPCAATHLAIVKALSSMLEVYRVQGKAGSSFSTFSNDDFMEAMREGIQDGRKKALGLIEKMRQDVKKSEPQPDAETQKIHDKFHAHIDGCAQCRENPFELCHEGLKLMVAVGG